MRRKPSRSAAETRNSLHISPAGNRNQGGGPARERQGPWLDLKGNDKGDSLFQTITPSGVGLDKKRGIDKKKEKKAGESLHAL